MSVKKYLTLNGLTYFFNKIKTYLTSSTYLNSIGISNSDIDDIADDAGYSSGSLPQSEDIFITGDIIPNTDNSVDLGASSKNIKMIYTKGITINGTQFLPSDYATLSDLSTVATSGSYNDLTNKPTIPTKISDLTNDSGYITGADLLPIGSYIQFAGSQAPAGFLVCNGGEISRTTYSALFAVIGTTYGSGDGSTTFNLPNLTDRFLQGSATSGTVKDAGLPNITGSNAGLYHVTGGAPISFQSGAIYTSVRRNWYVSPNANDGSISRGTAGQEFDASQSNSIYGNSATVQPPALTCLICIKY